MNRLYKAGGVLIRDRKLLLERHGGRDVYIIPGGKLEPGETAQQALIRELDEEFGISVLEDDLEKVGRFESPAVHTPDKIVQIDTFLVKKWSGEIKLQAGIEGIIWVNSEDLETLKGSSIAKEHIIPLIHKMGLID